MGINEKQQNKLSHTSLIFHTVLTWKGLEPQGFKLTGIWMQGIIVGKRGPYCPSVWALPGWESQVLGLTLAMCFFAAKINWLQIQCNPKCKTFLDWQTVGHFYSFLLLNNTPTLPNFIRGCGSHLPILAKPSNAGVISANFRILAG